MFMRGELRCEEMELVLELKLGGPALRRELRPLNQRGLRQLVLDRDAQAGPSSFDMQATITQQRQQSGLSRFGPGPAARNKSTRWLTENLHNRLHPSVSSGGHPNINRPSAVRLGLYHVDPGHMLGSVLV